LKKFPFIRGSQTVDIYQETLIALRFKAIPGFKLNKGMSFLNFAKLCIRRHLITMLNASRHKIKDKAINTAVSLDSSASNDDGEDGKNTLSNVIGDDTPVHDKVYERKEAFLKTKGTLDRILSDFEKEVLKEHLTNTPYKDIAKVLSNRFKEYYNAKSIDTT
jgi:RNA polymerase sporulation-specific sigma factor